MQVSEDGDGEKFGLGPIPTRRLNLTPISIPIGNGDFYPTWGEAPTATGISRPTTIPKMDLRLV